MPSSAALKPEQVSADSKPTLDAFTKNIGFTPRMMATFAQSPIAFKRVGRPARLLEQGARREDA
jgi:hypothetical protein